MNASRVPRVIVSDDLMIEAEKIISLIAASRRHLAEYKSIDLSAMEARVCNLCDGVRSMPDKSREDIRTIICTIIDNLDRLESEVVIHQQEIIARKKKISQRGAAFAYGGTMKNAPSA